MEERANRDFNVIIKREAEAMYAKRNIKLQILSALDANCQCMQHNSKRVSQNLDTDHPESFCRSFHSYFRDSSSGESWKLYGYMIFLSNSISKTLEHKNAGVGSKKYQFLKCVCISLF